MPLRAERQVGWGRTKGSHEGSASAPTARDCILDYALERQRRMNSRTMTRGPEAERRRLGASVEVIVRSIFRRTTEWN